LKQTPRVHPGIEYFRTAKGSGGKLAILTAYDFPLGRLLDEGGVDAILVGDSLGMVVLGHPDTTSVTMADMLHHTRAVARAVRRAPIIADLPIGSYETPDTALQNARALIAAGAHAVKLEGGLARRAEIAAVTRAGIPVMGHIGMLPQSVVEEGGYKIKGRTPEEAERLLADAAAVQDAGAFAVVLELVKGEAAFRITESTRIPTIGIGSGSGCDGQVLVTHDLIGLFPWFTPKFVLPRAQVAEEIRRAVSEFVTAIRAPDSE
jgi:3-methyl-2-oxobutanoate hydroxymethyltransferase